MEKKFLGTWPVRRIGKSENGIHLPSMITGMYSLYLDEKTGDVEMRKQGDLCGSR